MKKLLSVLKQPYPYYNPPAKTASNATWVFIAVTLFLYLFSPFGINKAEDKYPYIIICLAHSSTATLIYAVFFSVFNACTNQARLEEHWKVYKAILVLAAVLFFVGLGSFFIRPLIYNNPGNFSWRYFFEEVTNTFLAGTLLFIIFTLIDFYRLLKANQSNAAVLEQHIETQHGIQEEKHRAITAPANISFTIENEPYSIAADEFLFARADGNYVTFYLNQNNSIVKQLKRTPLKNIEEQVAPATPFLIRTHRAYLVNTKHIKKVAGNAQGYLLTFEHIDFAVPVSRAMLPAFKAVMNSI